MVLPVLNLKPTQSGYSFKPRKSVASVELDGGMPFSRKEYLNTPHTVSVQWKLTQWKYSVLFAFYNRKLQEGVLKFEMELWTDTPNARIHVCRFVEDNFNNPAVEGKVYTVTALLQVEPIMRDNDYDDSVLQLDDLYGEDGYNVLQALAYLVNVKMPATIGA